MRFVVLKSFWLVVFLALALPALVPGASTFTITTNGVVNISGLGEASGIAASRNNPGVLWTENDSGNPAVVYAIDTQGRLLGTYQLPGNTDNEDIGIGPGPITNVSYLYVTDIGDNTPNRPGIVLYQIPEPAVYESQTNSPFVNRAMRGTRSIFLNYTNGAHNAEAEFMDPVTGDWYVLTKASTTSQIWTAPKALLDASTNVALRLVGTLAFDVPSAADISPLGNEIIVRQEDFAQLFTRTNGQAITNALKGTPVSIPVAGTAGGEPNGEAIGFDSIGRGYFTLSESSSAQPLRYFARTSFNGPTPPRMILAPAASWRYLADGSNQGTAWRSPGFDDTTWSSGLSQFGYGDGDEQTVVSYGGNVNNKFITTYFRKTFTVTNVNRIANLTLKLVVTDGVLIYLNGTAVVAVNLTNDAPYTATATNMPLALKDAWQSFTINPRLLNEGTNIIAAETHLASATSTNLSFDLQLVATDAPFIVSMERLTNQSRLVMAGSSNSPTTIQASIDFNTWTNLANLVLTNGSGTFMDTQATNLSQRFYRANREIP